jgi:DeoR family deoxyribose operon repressor
MSRKFTRLRDISRVLREHREGISIPELSEHFAVSEMTVRRDLNLLAENGLAHVTHGRAYTDGDGLLLDNQTEMYTLTDAETRNREAKIRIGQKAASLIEQDDVIIIDTGSTTEFLTKSIPPNLNITVLCFTLNNMVELHRKKNCRVVLAGGYYHENSMMFESPEGVNLIKRHRASKAFISASGVSTTLGVTCANYYELETKTASIASSAQRILLVDSSKFDSVQSTFFADLEDFQAVITDQGISDECREYIESRNMRLYLA